MIDAATLPDQQLRARLSALADDMLVAGGYARIGFDHYARPENALARAAHAGRLKRNFQGFTDDVADTLLGFGASAISFVDGLYVQNEHEIGRYVSRVRGGESPVARGLERTRRENIVAAAIAELLCTMQTNISAVLRNAAPQEALRICRSLETLAADGVVVWRGDVITVAPQAYALARAVAMAIDPYAAPQREFAQAV
jgi:oxygen-independent coproporphyrinogen-3 oxidase